MTEKYDVSVFNDNMDTLDSAVNYNSLPIGAIIIYAGTAALDGFLECNGQAISRTTYAELFKKIGTTYGKGDSSSTFNLPDYSNRVPVGTSSSISLGKTGGEATHTLTVEEMPSHNHDFRGVNTGIGSNAHMGVYPARIHQDTEPNWTGNFIMNIGGGQAHNNLQPYIVVNYIIRVKNVDGILNLFTETESNNLFSDNENSVPTVSLIKNLTKFSTSEERRVGTWYNGKPIYSKTITGTKAGSFTLPSTIDEAWIDASNSYQKRYVGDSDIRIYPLAINQVSSQAQNNPALANQQAGAYINIKDKTLRIEIGAGVTSQGFVATIKYTKTTDTVQ